MLVHNHQKTYIILNYNYSENDYATDIILYNIVTRIDSIYIGKNGYIKWWPQNKYMILFCKIKVRSYTLFMQPYAYFLKEEGSLLNRGSLFLNKKYKTIAYFVHKV